MRLLPILFLIVSTLFHAGLFAQLGYPQVEEVYGGRIKWIEAAALDVQTTRVFISTESANSLFYADVDYSSGSASFSAFQTIADVDTNDGFGEGVSRFAADAASGWLYFIHNRKLYGVSTTPGSLTNYATDGVTAVEIYDGHMFYLRENGMSADLHFGMVDGSTGVFLESSDSPVVMMGEIPSEFADYALEVNPSTHTVYGFVAGTPGRIYRSMDNYDALGSSSIFDELDVAGLGAEANYRSFAVGPDGRLFVGTSGGIEPNHGKYIGYSDNDGAHWDTLFTGIGGTHGSNIAFAGPDTAYSVFFGSAVSDDRGETGSWRSIGWNGQETHPNDGPSASDPNDDNVVFMTTDQGIGASTTRGEVIFEIDEGVEAVQVNDFSMNSGKSIAWSASKSGIRKVTGYATGSESWSIYFPNNDGSPYYSAAMDINDVTGNTAYVGNVRVYTTSDGGSTWNQTLDTGDPVHGFDFWSRIQALAVHPDAEGVVLAGVNSPSNGITGGVFLSEDGGANWMRIETSPYNTEVMDLLITTGDDSSTTVYIACEYVSDGITSSYGVKRLIHQEGDSSITFDNDMIGESGGVITNFGANSLAANSGGDVYAGGRLGSAEEPRVYVKYADSTFWKLLPTATLPPTGSVSSLTIGEDPSGAEVPYVAVGSGVYYLDGTTWVSGYEYPVGTKINVLYWDDLLVGTGTGLYGHFFENTTAIDNEAVSIPDGYDLGQNYPNPFNPSTTIRYRIGERAWVLLEVFNILGQQVATLVNGAQSADAYEVAWEPSDIGSGIYFYKLYVRSIETGEQLYQSSRKMILLK